MRTIHLVRPTAAMSRALLVAAIWSVSALCWCQQAPQVAQIQQLLAADQLDEALAASQEWAHREPADPLALLTMARLQVEAGQFEAALDSLDAAYFLTRDPEALVQKGLVYLQWGRTPEAEAAMQEALQHSDSCAGAHAGLARVYLEQRRPMEARAAALAALGVDPNHGGARVVLARLDIADGNLAKAAEVLGGTASPAPQGAETALWLGNVLALQGRPEEARPHWRHFVEASPGDSDAWLLAHGLHPLQLGPYACPGAYPTFSPDGRRVAFRGNADPGSVYLAPADRPESYERLYEGDGTVYSLEWSPDGSRLACREYAKADVTGKQQLRYAIVVLTVDRPRETARAYEGSYAGECCFSPDGNEIWFDGYVPGKGRGMLAATLTGGEPRVVLLPQRYETFIGCRFSPADGRLLAQRWWQESREYQLLFLDQTDRHRDQLVAHTRQKLQFPVFTPDGSHLLYFMRTGGGLWDLVAQCVLAGSRPRPLLRGLRNLAPVAFADQGQQMVVADASGEYHLYRLLGLRP